MTHKDEMRKRNANEKCNEKCNEIAEVALKATAVKTIAVVSKMQVALAGFTR